MDDTVKKKESPLFLLVDDVPLNLKIISALLRKLNVETVETNGGVKALEFVKANRPDAVITDLWMSGLNGAQLAAAIKAADSTIKVYAITADAAFDECEEFDLSHFDGVFVKPVTFEKLKEIYEDLHN